MHEKPFFKCVCFHCNPPFKKHGMLTPIVAEVEYSQLPAARRSLAASGFRFTLGELV
jgi:hypothetical protein